VVVEEHGRATRLPLRRWYWVVDLLRGCGLLRVQVRELLPKLALLCPDEFRYFDASEILTPYDLQPGLVELLGDAMARVALVSEAGPEDRVDSSCVARIPRCCTSPMLCRRPCRSSRLTRRGEPRLEPSRSSSGSRVCRCVPWSRCSCAISSVLGARWRSSCGRASTHIGAEDRVYIGSPLPPREGEYEGQLDQSPIECATMHCYCGIESPSPPLPPKHPLDQRPMGR
jgi:hypothetical protein